MLHVFGDFVLLNCRSLIMIMFKMNIFDLASFFTLGEVSGLRMLVFVRWDLRLSQEVACSLWDFISTKRVCICLVLTLVSFSSSDFTATDGLFGDFSLFTNFVSSSLTPSINLLSFLTTLMPPMLGRMGVLTVLDLRLLDLRMGEAWKIG